MDQENVRDFFKRRGKPSQNENDKKPSAQSKNPWSTEEDGEEGQEIFRHNPKPILSQTPTMGPIPLQRNGQRNR
eukprot:scaffold15311_cov36-Cyclotella_meneghiniana.AAC.1